MAKYKSKTTAKRGADRWFSRYIRKKEADHQGYVTCITCGERKKWKEVDAGHFISRSYLQTRWDERNCFPQCKKCNMQGGEPDDYSIFLKKEFGEGIIKDLNEKKRNFETMTKQDFKDIADKYREKFKELENKDIDL